MNKRSITSVGCPSIRHSKRRRRHRALSISLSAFALVAVGGLAGCPTIPTPGEIVQQYDVFEVRVARGYQRLLNTCVDMPPPEKTQCQVDASQWLADRITELVQGEQAAVNMNWQDALDRRKQLEDALRDLIPDFPDLEDLLEPIFGASIVTIDLDLTLDAGTSSSSASSAGRGASGAAAAPPPDIFLVAGSASFTSETLTASTIMSGNLSFSGSAGPGRSYIGSVVSGQVVAVMDFGQTLTLTVVGDPTNKIVTNIGGQGSITVLFTSDYSQEGWNAILPHYARYQLPVSRDAQGTFHIVGGPIASWELQGHTPHPLSDYNLDGVLDHTSDSAAFLLDWGANDARADFNVDNVWDDSDVGLWEENFWLDVIRQ